MVLFTKKCRFLSRASIPSAKLDNGASIPFYARFSICNYVVHGSIFFIKPSNSNLLQTKPTPRQK